MKRILILVIMIVMVLCSFSMTALSVLASSQANEEPTSTFDDGYELNANWIWADAEVYSEQWISLRKTFTLDEVPEEAFARISADTKYWLWINGEMAIFEGQLKLGDSRYTWYYDKEDISEYLTEGENTIAVQVYYSGTTTGSTINSRVPSFLFQADIGDTLVCSDTTWRATIDPAYEDAGFDEHAVNGESSIKYVASNEMRDADGNKWTDKVFDDSEWKLAVNQDEKIRNNRIKDDSGNNSTVYYQDTDPRRQLVLRSIPQWYIGDLNKYTADGADGTGTYTVSDYVFAPLSLPEEYVLEAEVELPTYNNSAAIGLCVCVEDEDNFYMEQISLNKGLYFKPHKRQSSWSSSSTNLSDTELGKSIYDADNGVDNRYNTRYTVKIEVDASTIKTYLNGTLIGTVTDTSLAREGSSVGIRQAVSENLRLYSFKVTDTSGNELYNANIDECEVGDTIKAFSQLAYESTNTDQVSRAVYNTVSEDDDGDKCVTVYNSRVGVNDGYLAKTYQIVNATNQQGTPYLKVKSATGGEFIKIDSDHNKYVQTLAIRHRYVTCEGEQSWEALGWMNGYVFTFTIPETVEVLELGFRPSGYDTSATGSVTTDSDALNQIYQEAYDTLYVCMRDSFMDCPDRERLQWWGDTVSTMQRAAYSMDDNAALLYKKLLTQVMGFSEESGVLPSVVATARGCTELPMQSLAGVHSFWQYYMYYGDEETLLEAYPYLMTYLKLWEIYPNGTIYHRTGTWDWFDWGDNPDETIIENCWYYIALESVLKIADLEGSGATDEDIEFLTARMELISKNFDHLYWDESKNAYYYETDNGIADDRANALAVYSGLADKSRYDGILSVLSTVYNASPYMEKYVLEAMYLMDASDEAIARTIERYTPLIEDGYPTLSELFPSSGTRNHAWTGGPLSMLYMYNAGITPLTPEFKTFSVRPQLGTLTSINAYMERGSGKIEVSATKSATSFVLTVTVPDGAESALICVPRLKGIDTLIKLGDVTLYADGRAKGDLPTGISYAGEDVSYVNFLVPSGQYTFTASENVSEESDTYSFVVESVENGKISINGTEITSFPYTHTDVKDAEVSVTVTPDEEYRITAITGSNPETVISTEAVTRSYTLDGNKTFGAVFEKTDADYKIITITISDEDMAKYALCAYINGEMISLPYTGLYKEGTSINFTVNSASDYNYTVTVNGDEVKTVDFEVTENTDLCVELAESQNVEKITVSSVTVSKKNTNSTTWASSNLFDGIRVSTAESLGYSCAYSTDPDVSADPYEITYDFGQITAINQIALFPRSDVSAIDYTLSCNYPVDFNILVSRDGNEYETVLTVKDCPNPRFKQQCFEFDLVYARYIKLSVTKLGLGASDESRGTRPRLQLAEFEVYYNGNIIIEENYGAISEEYSDAEKYPFAVFGEEYGDFKGAFQTWRDAVDYVQGDCIGGSASSGKAVTVVLRRDYALQTTHTYSDGTTYTESDTEALWHNIGGTMAVDLIGHTITRNDLPLISVYSGKNEDIAYKTTLLFKNGEIATAGSPIMTFDHSSTVTEDTGAKAYDITFENVKFISGSSSSFILQTSDGTEGYGTKVDMTFNNCIFDVEAAADAITFMDINDDRDNSVDYNIVINGGSVINASANHTVATPGNKDTLTYGEYNGKYITISILTDLGAPTGSFTDSEGNTLTIAKDSVSGDYTVYTLSLPILTKYGEIPAEYQSTALYPLAVFIPDDSSDTKYKFATAYAAWADAIAKSDDVSGSVIYFRTDVISSKTAATSTFKYFSGTVTVDLNGYTLTRTVGYLINPYFSDITTASESEIIFKNGSIVNSSAYTNSFGLFCINYGTASTALATINLTFDSIEFINGKTTQLFFAAWEGGYTTDTAPGTKSTVIFNNCTIDSNGAAPVFLLKHPDDATKNKSNFDVTVNGGTIILKDELTTDSLYQKNSNDTINFGEYDGSYTKFVLPSSAAAPAITLNDGALVFTKVSEDDESVTYSLIDPSSTLGFVPKASITLDRNLVYNVYVPANAALKSFTLDGVSYTDTASLDNVVTLSDGKQYYHFGIELSASEAVRDIVLEAVVTIGGTDYSGTWTMNVPKYAKKVIADGNEVEVQLIKDILSYVKAAYTYFNTTGDVTDEALASAVELIEGIIDENYDTDNMPELDGSNAVPTVGVTGATFVLDATPAVRFYITGDADSYRFYANGDELETVAGTDKTGAYLEMEVYAYAMCETITYKIDGVESGSYHINSYYTFVMTDDEYKDNAELINLVLRFAKYCESARAYRNSVIEEQ